MSIVFIRSNVPHNWSVPTLPTITMTILTDLYSFSEVLIELLTFVGLYWTWALRKPFLQWSLIPVNVYDDANHHRPCPATSLLTFPYPITSHHPKVWFSPYYSWDFYPFCLGSKFHITLLFSTSTHENQDPEYIYTSPANWWWFLHMQAGLHRMAPAHFFPAWWCYGADCAYLDFYLLSLFLPYHSNIILKSLVSRISNNIYYHC